MIVVGIWSLITELFPVLSSVSFLPCRNYFSRPTAQKQRTCCAFTKCQSIPIYAILKILLCLYGCNVIKTSQVPLSMYCIRNDPNIQQEVLVSITFFSLWSLRFSLQQKHAGIGDTVQWERRTKKNGLLFSQDKNLLHECK